MDLVVANKDFLNFQDAWVRMATHPGARLIDLTKRHVFISVNRLAKLGFTSCFVTN